MWIYLLGIIQEYLVIINFYNGDILPKIDNEIQYCIPDLFILAYITYYYKKYQRIEFVLIISIFISHLQWYFHSPFKEWPKWVIGEKSANDIRHRTEYYDTHVVCFVIYLILFIRFYDKKY